MKPKQKILIKPKQKKILKVIKEFYKKNGYYPTKAEITRELGAQHRWPSTDSVNRMIKNKLVKKNKVTYVAFVDYEPKKYAPKETLILRRPFRWEIIPLDN